jgi:ABC-2 type transport system ATP-binding protein
MKQKLALACTLVHEPQVILLDEPTTGVDPVSRREFWKLLSEFLAQGITILMATPYLDEAERCSRVGLFAAGRLLVVDTPAALRESLPGVLTEIIASPQDRAIAALETVPAVAELQNFGERIHVRWREATPDAATASARKALASAPGVATISVRAIPASLEDVFINRIAQAEASAAGAK